MRTILIILFLLLPSSAAICIPWQSAAEWASEAEYHHFQRGWVRHGLVAVERDGVNYWFYRGGKKCRF